MIATFVKYEADKDVFRVEFEGKLDFSEIKALYSQLIKSGVFPQSCHRLIIIDKGMYRGKIATNVNDLQELYLEFPEIFNHARIAICTENLQMHAISYNAYDTLKKPINRPFSSEADAYSWLKTPY